MIATRSHPRHLGKGEHDMGIRHVTRLCVCCCAGILLAGCDPVRTTVQPVRLQVTGPHSTTAVRNARVSLKFDYDGNVPATDRLPEAQRPSYLWFSGETGETGEAEILVKWTMLDRSLGPNPPAWRDQVTGRAYLVRVEKGQTQEVSLVMSSGASVEGEDFDIEVLNIEEPRYIETD